MNNKILIGLCFVAYLFSGNIPGCQSKNQPRQSINNMSGMASGGIYLGNSPLAQDITKSRDMEAAARMKAYQMYLDYKLKEFQESLGKR